MSDIEPEDIRAVRAEDGGLRALLRAQIDIGKARRQQPPAAKPPPPPGYRPGAWPTGTRPPDPPPSEWSPEWDAALAAYRAYIVATEHRDRLREDPGQTCHCKPCTDLRRNL